MNKTAYLVKKLLKRRWPDAKFSVRIKRATDYAVSSDKIEVVIPNRIDEDYNIIGLRRDDVIAFLLQNVTGIRVLPDCACCYASDIDSEILDIDTGEYVSADLVDFIYVCNGWE